MPAYFETGFFVRQPAWHGLGEVVPRPPQNAEDACFVAGLNWEVKKTPMFYSWRNTEMRSPYYAIVRQSDGKVLGRCQDKYEPFQNIQAFRWCEPLLDTELWAFETGGALYGGRTCWVLLKQDETMIVPNDVLRQYLLFMWDHTGKRASVVRPVSIRVVCANTLAIALDEEGITERIWHDSKQWTRLEVIQEYYKQSSLEFARQQTIFQKMANTKWGEWDREQFVNSLCRELGGEEDSPVAQKRRDVLGEMVVEGRASGTQELGIKDTVYGALMGATEYFEHYHGGNSVKDRGANILMGKANRAVDEAFYTACDMAGIDVDNIKS